MDFVKKDVPLYGEYDLVVAGGGPAGIGAAIAAARGGLKTVMLELNGCMGGTSTSGNLPFFLGAFNGSMPFRKMIDAGLQYKDLNRPRRAVRGVYDLMVSRMKAQNGGVGPAVMAQTDKYPILDRFGCHDEFTFDIEIGKRVFDEMAKEFGLDVLYYTTALDTELVDNEIQGVYIVNKSGIQFIKCKAVIDCTGDADLIARSGYATYKGDKETGEMTAIGLVAQIENVDSSKIAEYLEQGGDPWFPEAVEKAVADTEEGNTAKNLHAIIAFPMVQDGVWMVNGGTSHGWVGDHNLDGTCGKDLSDLTMIGRQRAKWMVEKLWRPYIPGAENCRLRSTATYPGIRETRRIIAERMLTEEDLIQGIQFEDTIAFAGRHFDLTRRDNHEEHVGDVQGFAGRNKLGGGIAAIPYSAMIPKGSKNILAAGRCIAADGQALGPVRIMSTCMAIGEAAGTAAIQKIRDGVDFKDIDIKELRDTLRANGAEVDF